MAEIKKANPEKFKESIQVRGICETISKMAYPDMDSLNDAVAPFGYKLIKVKKAEMSWLRDK